VVWTLLIGVDNKHPVLFEWHFLNEKSILKATKFILSRTTTESLHLINRPRNTEYVTSSGRIELFRRVLKKKRTFTQVKDEWIEWIYKTRLPFSPALAICNIQGDACVDKQQPSPSVSTIPGLISMSSATETTRSLLPIYEPTGPAQNHRLIELYF